MKFQIFNKSLRKRLVRHGTVSRIFFEHAHITVFTELHQIDPSTMVKPFLFPIRFLNSAAGGNLLERSAQDVLKIIENKSKVRNSRNKPIVSQVKQSNRLILSEIASVVTSRSDYNQGNSVIVPKRRLSVLTTDFAQRMLQAKSRGLTRTEEINFNQEPEVATKPKPKPSIPYPSRLSDQKLREKANNQMLNFLQIIQRLHFDISFTDALLHMLKFASTFKSLLSNKKKLFELANTPLNENCLAVLLKKLPKKLGDPGKFLIPCDFPELDECLALSDLGASINLMPLSITMLILGRTFLRKERALIDVYGEELTLRVDDGAITFKVGQTSRDSCSYETINQVNVIDVACEEYAQEVLGFSDSSSSGNPTPSDPIIASSSPLFTPFEGGDFILEEIDTFLHTPEELSNLDDDYYDTEGDILYLENC
ncbi:hypothetical protein Tco_0843482 [Tanacetum coccineum]|uniref:Reverse transcriptase domain-containing protein n=1 Tax=Tanacetum coccineum TaxID=301880 RepID=A0ABQ5B2D0_9ASTR